MRLTQRQTKYPLWRGAHHFAIARAMSERAQLSFLPVCRRAAALRARGRTAWCMQKVVYSHLHSLLHQLCHCYGANVIMSFSYGWSCGQYNEYGQNCNWENYPGSWRPRSVLALSSSYAQSSPS